MFPTYYTKIVVNDDTLLTFVFLYHSGLPQLKILQKQTDKLFYTAIILLPEPFLWKLGIVCKFEVAPKLEGLLRDASCALKPILTLCWLCFDLHLWCMCMVKVAEKIYALCSCEDRIMMTFNSLFLMLCTDFKCVPVCYTNVITSLDT